MIELLGRIKRHLQAGAYRNEAAVSSSVVLPLLRSLSWDDSDPSQIVPEYANGSRRVDFALCASGRKPHIFVEVKGVGRAQDADRQLFEYAFHEGVPLCILTDGNEWSFYLPSGQGNYDERKVHFLKIEERPLGDVASIFERYLERSRVSSGEAFEAAQKDYREAASRREAEKHIPAAWQKLIDGSEEFLVELVAMEAETICGYRPSEPQVMSFLRSLSRSPASSDRSVVPQAKLVSVKAPHSPAVVSGRSAELGSRSVHYSLHGTVRTARDASEATVTILKELFGRYPQCADEIARAVRGKSRNHIARTTEEIYPKRPDLARAVEIAPGWLLGLNIANREKMRILREACRITGLEFGSDLTIDLPNA